MRRREFIAGLGGAAVSTAIWPLGARAQQPAMPVIGYLGAGSAELTTSLAPFHEGLREAGYVEGRNLGIEYRWAVGQFDRLPALAADLVRRPVALIFATGGMLPAVAAKAATSTIPIVFQGGGLDPVSSGLVASLNRPGGNVTGAMNLSSGALDAKGVQFLHELVPAAASIGVLVNRGNRSNEPGSTAAQAAARALGWEFHVLSAGTDDELEIAFATFAQRRVGAVLVTADPFFTNRRSHIVTLAAKHAIPASYSFRDFVLAGGLMSYGSDIRESNRLAGNYVGRILKGEQPANLPVQQATRIEMAINLKTARTLGLTFPVTLLGRADEVIE
jgi:putative ABC transport system substrate-binding protein